MRYRIVSSFLQGIIVIVLFLIEISHSECKINIRIDTLVLNNVKFIVFPSLYEYPDSLKIIHEKNSFYGKLFLEFDSLNYFDLINDSNSFSINNGYFIHKYYNKQYKFFNLSEAFWFSPSLRYEYGERSEELNYFHYYKLFLKRNISEIGKTIFSQLRNTGVNIYKKGVDKYYLILELEIFKCSYWRYNDFVFFIPHEDITIIGQNQENSDFNLVNFIKFNLKK